MLTKYEMIGQFTIPEDKREELNSLVLKLLDVGGVRRLKTVKIDGKRVKVTTVPKPDAKGIVRFNYSIFEKKEFGENTYDTNTCQLVTSKDRDGNEFGFILNLIMTMQEMYSVTPYVMVSKYKYDDTYKVVDVDGYLEVLQELLHIKVRIKHREDFWELLKIVKSEPKTADISYRDIEKGCPFYLYEEDGEKWSMNFITAIYCNENRMLSVREECRGGRDDIQNPEKNVSEYTCQLFKEQLEKHGQQEVDERVRRILGSSLEDRKKLAQTDDNWGILAEVSVYRSWFTLFNAYRHALGACDAWELWKRLGVECYKDFINLKADEKPPKKKVKEVEAEVTYPVYDIFARASGRESHDDFLELGQDIKQLELSEVLEDAFEDWRKSFDSIADNRVEAMDVEHILTEVLSQMKEDWGIDQVVSEAFVHEILEHKDSLDHRKLLALLEEECKGEAMLYPELTVYQSRYWISGIFGKAKIITRIKGLVALIANTYMREKILGI